jgi:hypothetical protein
MQKTEYCFKRLRTRQINVLAVHNYWQCKELVINCWKKAGAGVGKGKERKKIVRESEKGGGWVGGRG